MMSGMTVPVIPREPWRFYAEIVFERIKSNLSDVKATLKDGEFVVVLVPLHDGTKVLVDTFSYHNPNFIIVEGTNAQSNRVTVLLSHTDVQIIFQIMTKDAQQPPTRKEIGFVTPKSE